MTTYLVLASLAGAVCVVAGLMAFWAILRDDGEAMANRIVIALVAGAVTLLLLVMNGWRP